MPVDGAPGTRRAAGIVIARFVVTFAAVLGMAVLAGAHSALKSSKPADGARLEEMPQAVELTFTEPVETALSVFKVYPVPAPPDALADLERLNGMAAELVSQVLSRKGDEAQRADAGLGTKASPSASVTIRLKPGLKPGAYVVMWRVLSVDTHPTQGFVVFVYER
ncbi:MAG: copper resistance protein CopC [Limnochordaceae bacterium]|nr:copper resistance protein CopC [Limnochordaceae bacterium]